MDIVVGVSVDDSFMRSMVMETAGLWYFNRTSSLRQNFLHKLSVSYNLSSKHLTLKNSILCAHMASPAVSRESHVYPFDVLWQYDGAGTEANSE